MSSIVRITSRRLLGSVRPRKVFLAACDGDVDRLLAEFDRWCSRHAGTACELFLSSRWGHAVVAPAAAGPLDASELRRYAERQMAHYFSDSRASATARWAFAVSPRSDVPLVLAAPQDLIDRLQATAGAHRVQVSRIVPWWLGAARQADRTPCIVHAMEPGLATIIEVSHGRLARVAVELDNAAGLPREPGDVRPVSLWNGPGSMPSVCDDPAVVKVLSHGLSRHRPMDMDLQGDRIRTWRASWACLMLATAGAAAAARHHDDLLDRQANEQATLVRAQMPALHPRGARGGTVQPGSAAPEAGSLQAALDMLALRDHPWADVFSGVESASRGVAVLGLQHDGAQAVVHIEVTAPGDDAAWAFAEKLASETAHFSEAALLARESLEPSSGGFTVRAQVRAVLKGFEPDAETRP